jgi:DNA-binding response OmpR family regulator
MKIFILEDDEQLKQNLKLLFKRQGFAADTFSTFKDAWHQISEFGREYDCIVLDVNLPDGNGFTFCEQLRQHKINTPVVIMTARQNVKDKIHGLNIGADDYVTKPIDFEELIARVRAVIRRNSKNPSPTFMIGNLKINPQTQRVTRGKKTIEFTSKEFAILELMARHYDEVITRTMIMEHVWGSDFETFSNVIDVYIKNLRSKIDLGQKQKLIHTIRGKGYRLSDKQ